MAAVVGALVTVAGCTPDAVSVAPPSPGGQVLEQCDHLNNRLPAKITGLHTRPTNPQSSLTHAWGSPPITLACGVPRPAGYSPTSSATLDVNGVRWFQKVGHDVVVWTAVRPGPAPAGRIYVALRVPTSYQASDGFLTALAEPLKIALP
ncbi:MAG TPA: DUF3515 family protein [Mycobacteriales bacterium]|nr:DUF3515 family protein [Mycobacteriales bacterium]